MGHISPMLFGTGQQLRPSTSPSQDDTDLRLMPGDELRLKHRNASNRGPWEGVGNVIRFDQTEEVCLELRDSVSAGSACVGRSASS